MTRAVIYPDRSKVFIHDLKAFLWIAGILVSGLLCAPLQAHKVSSASVILDVDTENERNFVVSVAMEVESSGDAQIDDEIGPEDAGKAFVENNLLVLVDEKELPLNLSTKLINESDEDTPKELQRLSVIVEWTGDLPEGGRDLSLFLKDTSEMSIVLVPRKNGIPARRFQVLFAGEYSKAINIEPILKENPFDHAEPTPENTEPEKGEEEPISEKTNPEVIEKVTTSLFWSRILAGTRGAGFKLFLPIGLLFALLIQRGSFRSLLAPFGLFALAHSLGFILSGLGVIPPLQWAIYLSIGAMLVLGIHNLVFFRFSWWRYVVGGLGAFFLGNAMVQAGSFLALGEPPVMANAIAAFQLGFIFIALITFLTLGLLLYLFGRNKLFRVVFVIPASTALAGLALFLILENIPVISTWLTTQLS